MQVIALSQLSHTSVLMPSSFYRPVAQTHYCHAMTQSVICRQSASQRAMLFLQAMGKIKFYEIANTCT